MKKAVVPATLVLVARAFVLVQFAPVAGTLREDATPIQLSQRTAGTAQHLHEEY